MAEHNEIGAFGEKIAQTFLMKQGYDLKETNSRSHFGEIDIIATRDGFYYFVEVKSLKVQSLHHISLMHIDPRDNLTDKKLSRFMKTVGLYAMKHHIPETLWRIVLICVYIDMTTRQAKVEVVENVNAQ